MKKQALSITIIAAIAITTLLAFSSCQKDGVYKPKKHISKIFNQGNLYAMWKWEDKQLTQITYESGSYDVFEYNKKGQVIARRYFSGSGTFYDETNFVYDGKKLQKISYYEGTSLASESVFTYDGNKIVTIVQTNYITESDYYKKNSAVNNSLFTTLFPDPAIYQSIEKPLLASMERASKTKGSYTITYNVVWEKNNIKSMTAETLYDGSFERTSADYTYDEMKNPFYGNFAQMETAADFSPNLVSKNNVVSVVVTSSDGLANRNWTYTYEGDYPVTQTAISSNYTYTTFYEYE